MMSRVPIRIRLSLGFALVMGVLLAVVGLFVYDHLEDGLDETIDRELSARLAGAIAIVRDDGDDLGDPARDPLVRVDPGGYVQVLGPDGEVVSATSETLLGEALVEDDPEAMVDLDSGSGFVRARDVTVPDIDLRLRVAAATARDDGVAYTVIAGASLEQRDETLDDLRNLLWIGGPFLLLISVIAGYVLAAAALRPVERMRERAAALSGEEVDQQLPVSPASDEISRLGETLNAMLSRVGIARRRERDFVADASHELRTPLSILRAELDLAGKPGRSEGETSRAIASALEETDRLITLTDDLLVLSRADAGALQLDLRPVDLGLLVEAAKDRLRPLAREMEVEVSSRSESVLVRADSERLGQAVYNLLANAYRHARSQVSVELESGQGKVGIRVLDDGPGFPADMLATAPSRFKRRGDAGSSQGSGLGLAIASEIAIAHGGRLVVANQPDGGADVKLELPEHPAAL